MIEWTQEYIENEDRRKYCLSMIMRVRNEFDMIMYDFMK